MIRAKAGSPMVSRVAAPVVALLALAVLAPVVRAQETPRYGGELVFVVPAESPSFDAITPSHFLNNQLDTVWLAE